jgi:hypothetical protein
VLRGLTLSIAASCLTLPLWATTIELTRAAECAVPLRFEIRSEGASSPIDVAAGVSSFDSPEGVLTLSKPPSCWTAPVILGKEPLKLEVRKARSVRGSIAPSDHGLPQSMSVAFRPPKAAEGTLVTEVVAIGKDRSFTMRLPADPLDLRIEVARFAPIYLWRFDSEVIPPLKLIPGASVSGWVTVPSKSDLTKVTVRLIPATATWQSPDSEDQKLQSRSVRAGDKGFFQIAGIEAGTWSLVAEAPELSSTRPLEIELREGTEEALRRPLELGIKGSLRVSITPLVSFDGSPWKVQLQRRVPLSRFTKVVATEPASLAGQWTKEGLEAGSYFVTILGARGEAMEQEDVELEGAAAHVDVHIDAFPVRGNVTLAGKPVRVEMKWITMRGESIRMETDEEGAFETVLPKAGTWYVGARSGKTEYLVNKKIEVEARDDGPSIVDIKIPAGTIRGKVVDRSGRAAADIVAYLEGMSTLRAVRVADDATFEFIGLGEGLYTARAENKTLISNTVPVTVSESVTEVTLVVDAIRRVTGWLTTPSSAPLAGAEIWYWTATSSRTPAQSGPSGQFTLTLPSSATSVHLAIVTPSRPAKLVTVPLPPEGERLHVTLSPYRSTLRLKTGNTPPWPYVFSRDGAGTSLLSLLRMPAGGMQPEWLDAEVGIALAIEPGVYDFCDSRQRNRCVTAQANAGATQMVDLTGLWSTK